MAHQELHLAASAPSQLSGAMAPSQLLDKRLRVLMLSGDMPSHPVAVAKLARHLAKAGHEVTFVVPAGDAVRIAEKEVKGADRISVVAVGHTTTTTHLNVHGSADASAWCELFHRLQHPVQETIAKAAEFTVPMFKPLLELMQQEPRPDIVVIGHYLWSTGGDAAELAGLPTVTFVHLPYDPALFLGEEATWRLPRMIPSFPHVASYHTLPPAGPRGWLQVAWKWLDAWVASAAWASSAHTQNALRASRGLKPNSRGGWAGYLSTHPTIVLGGPPLGPAAPVPPLATVVGEVEVDGAQEVDEELATWLEQAGPQGIIFASMGTGMTLNDVEASQVAGGLGRRLAGRGGPRLLWALRASEQERLQKVLEGELGSETVGISLADGTRSYQGDLVRVVSYAPQAAILSSGRVSLFLSHMGFGACTEGVKFGCVFLSYPGGFDQEFNATRAEEAGFARRAPKQLLGVEVVAREMLADENLRKNAVRAQRQLAAMGGPAAAVQAVEKFAAIGREGAEALVLPFATHREIHRGGSICSVVSILLASALALTAFM